MQFLKGLFWFLLAVVIAVFSIGNWTTVPIRLWGGLIADVNLPLLLVLVFLAGFLPMLLWHQALKWRFRQKLSATERALAEVKAAAVVATPPRVAPEPGDMPPPLGALPLDPAPPVPAPPKAT